MNNTEQTFSKLENETNNNKNNTPPYIKQAEYYKNCNKLLKYKKTIYSIELTVHSDGKIFANETEMVQYPNNCGYMMININNKQIYTHHIMA